MGTTLDGYVVWWAECKVDWGKAIFDYGLHDRVWGTDGHSGLSDAALLWLWAMTVAWLAWFVCVGHGG